MSFRVRACHDAHVLLSEQPGITNVTTYEIIIGGWKNTQSVIRRAIKGENKAAINRTGLLACKELRPFWVSWELGTIKVGRGLKPPNGEFLSWKDPKPFDIHALSGFSGYGATAEWRLELKPGKISVQD